MTGGDPARQERLRRVLAAARLDGDDARPLPSDSNDVWRIGELILRTCYRGDPERFERDGLVAVAAPPAVLVPRLLDQGQAGELRWQLVERVDGVPLEVAWPQLATTDRERAIRQIGAALAELNAHRFPAGVRAALGVPRPAGARTLTAVLGSDVNPLPVPRARLLLDPAARVPYVDPALIEEVAVRFEELEPVDPLGERALADIGGGVVVHNDAHPMNVLWNDGVVALIDWEWTRLGPPEMEIEPYLHRGTDPEAQSAQELGWLAAAHPGAFAAPDLLRRVWLIQLARTLREVLLWPPDRPEPQLVPGHPLRRLRLIAYDADHLERTLPPG